MTLHELSNLQKKFDSEHRSNFDWSTPIDDDNLDMMKFLIIALTGEVGEAANIVKQIVRGDFTINDKKSELAEEISDIFIYTLKLAYQMDIDLEKEYLKKLEKNQERFKHYEKSEE
jgi:NTP pyrophosphatase (non-canonical NTP hydrolase)